GTVITNPDTLETNIRGIFADGDVVTGPFTAISAIAQGGKAAQAIMHFLTQGECKSQNQKFYSFKHKLATLSSNEFEKFGRQQRGRQAEVAVEDRITCFQEVEKGFSEAEALHETGRCIECGCTEYADCRLRKYCDEYQINVEAVTGEVRKYKIDDRHPFIRLDPNKCINCGKCVRMCSEILGVSALGFVYRGFKSIVKPAMEKPLAETNCISCGNCIDVCPTGAIAEKFPFKLLGALEKENITTVCNFCSLGCLINIKKMANGIVYVANTTEEIAASHNHGFLCAKGRFGHRYLLTKERVSNAAIKQDGQQVQYSMDEAIEYSAQKLKFIIEQYGTDSVAIMASPKLSNEELYLLQKLARVGLQNNNIGSFSVNQLFAESTGNSASILSNNSCLKMEELHNADIIVILNANLPDDFLPLELQIKAIQKKGAKVVLFSSTETRLAKSADLWLDCKKGLPGFVLGCMMKRCIENANFDELFISNTVDNFPEFKEQICALDIEAMLKFAGLNREKFVAFASMMQSAEANIAFICSLDSMPGTSVSSVKAIENYLLLTGRANKANNGLLLLQEFNNSAGLTTMGASSQFMPGSVNFNNVEATDRIGHEWDTNLADIFHPVDVYEKLKQGEIKALLVFGEDPLFDAHNEKYMGNIEFLLISSPFNSVTMQNADVILPAAAFTEDDGTYTRFDNTLQNAPKIKQGSCQFTNWEVIQKLGTYFTSCMNYNSIAELREEILRVTDLANASSEVTANKNTKDRKTCSFTLYDSNLSSSSAIKPSLHYQENYYFSHIKMQII
ncbi:MAG: molybdopterin-dependent oxidoreductase, partial [Ignavibacteriales bacterium]|nr:molybdopterin-dependent oxidoreductase [Ignavibacteriales bacterium]